MAERLTEKDSIENKRYVLNSEDNQIILTSAKLKNGFRKAYCWGKPIDKLAMLEDIMERLGINFVEDLEDEIRSLRVDKYVYRKDRDIWQKACELACETLKQVMGKPLWIGGNIPTPEVKDSDYFYQQAKKENNCDSK